MIKKIGPLYKETVGDAQNLALTILGIDRDIILNEDIIIQKINRITGVHKTIHNQLKKTLFEGIELGENIESLATRVKSVYNIASNRAKVIARTEVAQAVNQATMIEYKNSGILKHSWLTAGDEDVREEHISNQAAGPIGIGETFPSGETYPGESSPNCRCTLIPVI